MESCIILGLSLLALAYQTKAVSQCPVDVAFIMDSSECISPASFQKEKNFVKQAAQKIRVASGQSKTAIIQFSRSVSLKAQFGQYPSKQAFESAVDGLPHELPRTPSYQAGTQIEEALTVAANNVFSRSATSTRRVAVLLTDGKQVIASAEVANLKRAIVSLRKLGVQLLVVTMDTSSSALDRILKKATERDGDVVMANQFNDLWKKLSSLVSCGSCVCTTGDSYITIGNYKPKKNRAVDDIRFEFKSLMSAPGRIMTVEGYYVDHVSVGYNSNKRLWYNVNLGSGDREIESRVPLRTDGWHRVHITRNEKSAVEMKIFDADGQGLRQTTITGMNKLDIPSSKAYFLGLPKRTNKPSTNFVGCIRYLTVDGYEPIVNAWAGNPDSSIVKASMRPCTASDEMQS